VQRSRAAGVDSANVRSARHCEGEKLSLVKGFDGGLHLDFLSGTEDRWNREAVSGCENQGKVKGTVPMLVLETLLVLGGYCESHQALLWA
jgi:hypothetical protein